VTLAERAPLLRLLGPLTVKEVEARVFHAARSDPQFEASQRTWLEEDRSYFVRWHPATGAPMQVIGLVQVFKLPEMASRVEVVAFDDQAPDESGQALRRYVGLLRAELEREGFA